MNQDDLDRLYMRRALHLAEKGRGRTSPNPMVGAIIVSRGGIVGQAYHHRAGEPHAEVLALESAGRRARNATLYVTLEPCCHINKRTPPCVPTLIESGLKRIVVAMPDPNPLVRGRGISRLRKAGVKVAVGCLDDEAEQLNEIYVQWVRTGRPFVIMKAAMTLDGKIATASGQSQWITGEEARRHSHRVRSRVDAVMVGIGTVLHDDPQLTARLPDRIIRQPLRVVLDSRLRIPFNAKLLAQGQTHEVLIATTKYASQSRREALQQMGAAVLTLPMEKGRVSLKACLIELAKRNITSVLLEGGSELNAAALQAGMVDRVHFYLAPSLLGGQDAKGVIGGHSPLSISDARRITDLRIKRIGEDLFIDGRLQKTLLREQ